MSDDTRERARQVAHEARVGICNDVNGHCNNCDAVTDALVNAARNERIRWADRVEALAREYSDARHTLGLRALAAELRAEGGNHG